MVWDTGDVRLPEFTLRREGVFDELRSMLGGSDVDFEEDRAFSNAYLLQGPNEEAIRDMFTPEVRSFFVTNPGQNVAVFLDQLVWWIDERLPPPANLDAFLGGGAAIRQLFLR